MARNLETYPFGTRTSVAQREAVLQDVLGAAPSTGSLVKEIGAQVSEGRYYNALRSTKQLINYEAELLKNARQSD